jgi:hypothetical protein
VTTEQALDRRLVRTTVTVEQRVGLGAHLNSLSNKRVSPWFHVPASTGRPTWAFGGCACPDRPVRVERGSLRSHRHRRDRGGSDGSTVIPTSSKPRPTSDLLLPTLGSRHRSRTDTFHSLSL